MGYLLCQAATVRNHVHNDHPPMSKERKNWPLRITRAFLPGKGPAWVRTFPWTENEQPPSSGAVPGNGQVCRNNDRLRQVDVAEHRKTVPIEHILMRVATASCTRTVPVCRSSNPSMMDGEILRHLCKAPSREPSGFQFGEGHVLVFSLFKKWELPTPVETSSRESHQELPCHETSLMVCWLSCDKPMM